MAVHDESLFDPAAYEQEVQQRWGADAYEASQQWWDGLDDSGRRAVQQESRDLAEAWQQAFVQGFDVHSESVQTLAARHRAWIQRCWAGREVSAGTLAALANMYVEDHRFAAVYGGPGPASFVRDALIVQSERMGSQHADESNAQQEACGE